MMNDQNDVYNAVVARGYREGWSADQFLARQIAKLAEELGESSFHIASMDFQRWVTEVHNAGRAARFAFAQPDYWDQAAIVHPDGLARELADLQVVLFCAAAALGEVMGEPFDLVQAARDKALADVKRGVR